jgi:hypothetical protein
MMVEPTNKVYSQTYMARYYREVVMADPVKRAKHLQRCREYQRTKDRTASYEANRKRYATDDEYKETVKAQARSYYERCGREERKRRYDNDPVYRQRMIDRAKLQYQRKKATNSL